MRWLAFLGLILGVVFTACEDEGNEGASPTETATSVPTATAAPLPTSAPTLPPEAAAYRLVFLRSISAEDEDFNGQLWTSRLDGSGAAPLTPDGVTAVFAGVSRDGNLYYVEFQGSERILRAAGPAPGPGREIARFRARHESDGYAQVSPDGTRAAYVDIDSIYLVDLASSETTLLLQGSSAPCDSGPGNCYTYRTLWWSPDGSLLAALKVYYEGSDIVVIDPDDPVERIVAEGHGGNYYFGWSPAGDAVCVAGHYAATSAVRVARSPDWVATQTFFPEFEPDLRATPRPADGTPAPPGTVTGCGWPDEDHVLAAISHADDAGVSYLALADVTSGEAYLSELEQEDDPWGRQMVSLSGERFAVTQAYPTKAGNRTLLQPVVFDTAVRRFTPVLEPGDWVVAVIGP